MSGAEEDEKKEVEERKHIEASKYIKQVCNSITH